MTPAWKPYREPWWNTALRTGGIALAAGMPVANAMGGLSHWPLAVALVLWFSLGGHFIEVGFLNGLRPRLPARRPVQVVARLAVWLLGGACLGLGITLTRALLAGETGSPSPAWWLAGPGFVGLELFVHSLLKSRGRPNFYDGQV